MRFGAMGARGGFGGMGTALGRAGTSPVVFGGTPFRLDFVNNTATLNGAGTTLAAMLTFSRTGTAWAEDASGVVSSFATGVMRRTNIGSLQEGSRTNIWQRNRDATNASWIKTNCTAALDQTGIDGTANSASSLLATGANATALITITDTSKARIVTAYVKRLVGSGTISLTMDNSTYTDVTSGMSTAELALWNGGSWARTRIPTQTLANPVLGFKIATSGDKIAIDGCQSENSGLSESSVIFTAGASVVRNAETMTLTDPTLVSPYGGEWKIEVGKLMGFGAAVKEILNCRIDASNKIGIENNANDKMQSFSFIAGAFQGDGLGSTTVDPFVSTNAVVRDTVYRCAFRYAANDFATAYTTALEATVKTGATGLVAPSAFVGIFFGSNNGAQQLYGYLRSIEYIPYLSADNNTALAAWAN